MLEESTIVEEKDITHKDQSWSKFVLDCLGNGERGDGELFAALHKGIFVFDKAINIWFEWSGHYWRPDKLDEVVAAVDSVVEAYSSEAKNTSDEKLNYLKADEKAKAKPLEDLEKTLAKRITELQCLKRRKNILQFASVGSGSLAITGEEWDKSPWVLACSNGVLDLKTGKIREGKPDEYIRSVAPTEWKDLKEHCPAWEEFLSGIFNGDDEIISFMHKVLGCSLVGSTAEPIFPMLCGKGRNGKSTLVEMLKKVLGNSLTGSIPAEMFLNKKVATSSAGPRADIMFLKGKRLVWGSEPKDGEGFDVAIIKWLTGGDTLVGRTPHAKHQVNFDPSHTLLLLMNYKPKANPEDYAFWQRAALIPFEVSFVRAPEKEFERPADPNIQEKLIAESSGILAWLVRGCLEWQKEGKLTIPEKIQTATMEYAHENDILGNFIKDCLVEKPDGQLQANVLYEAYTNWCYRNGHRAMSNTKFGLLMAKRYIKSKGSIRYYYGIDLKAEDENIEQAERFVPPAELKSNIQSPWGPDSECPF